MVLFRETKDNNGNIGISIVLLWSFYIQWKIYWYNIFIKNTFS